MLMLTKKNFIERSLEFLINLICFIILSFLEFKLVRGTRRYCDGAGDFLIYILKGNHIYCDELQNS